MRVELDHMVPAPVERVFAVVSDISARPRWVGIAAERTPLDDTPIGVGKRYHAVDSLPGRRLSHLHQIDVYEPHERFGESWDGPMGGHSVITFASQGGGTRITVTTEMSPPAPLDRVPALARRVAMFNIRRDLRRLDRLLTSRA